MKNNVEEDLFIKWMTRQVDITEKIDVTKTADPQNNNRSAILWYLTGEIASVPEEFNKLVHLFGGEAE